MGLSHSPSIVTDGLDFYVDPNNTRSYPGFGNTVYNIANSSIGATFVNSNVSPIDSTNIKTFYLSGSNYVVGPNDIALINNFTISIWFKLKSYSDSGIISKWYADLSNNHRCWFIGTDSTQNAVVVVLSSNGTYENSTIKRYVIPVTLNQYTQLTITFSPNNLLVYKNGVLSSVTKVLDASITNVFNTSARPIQIGYNFDGSNYYISGNVGEAQIYSRVLTPSEIFQNYHTTKKKYLIEENIVTNGLILNLDPGNPNSYSGSGNTVFDLAGFGNTGTLVNGPAFSSLNSGSLSFDGTNDYMYVQHNNSQNITNITMSAWFNFPTVPFSGLGINKEGAYRLLAGESYTSTASGRIGGSWGTGVGPGSTTLRPNRWYQISMTADGTTQKLYVNGSLDYTLNNSALASINSNVLSFATYHYGAANFMNCQMSQALIYNRALTAQEIQQNYNATKGRFLNALPPVRNGLILELDAANTSSYSGFGNTWYDLTGNGNNYTLTNGPVFSSFGTTQNFFFDGSNDRALAVNPISLGTTHTVSMIVRPNSVSEDGVLFGDIGYSNTGYAFYLNSGNYLYYNAGSPFVGSATTTANNWYMFSVTRTNTSVSLYQNGALLTTATLGGNDSLTLRSIADFSAGGYPFAGNISQVSCYNRALSAYEIKQNFDFYRTRYGI